LRKSKTANHVIQKLTAASHATKRQRPWKKTPKIPEEKCRGIASQGANDLSPRIATARYALTKYISSTTKALAAEITLP
jgi:uncharacterized membrane protein